MLLSACANGGSDYRREGLMERNGKNFPATNSGAGSEDDYACPSTSNIEPDYDRWLDGSMTFTACKHLDSAFKILIHGKTRASDTICVYPAQYIDQRNVYLKPDLSGTGPLHQCMQISAAGVFVDFDRVNYNAVFIVEKSDESQMTNCLAGGNYALCPIYSFGRFR